MYSDKYHCFFSPAHKQMRLNEEKRDRVFYKMEDGHFQEVTGAFDTQEAPSYKWPDRKYLGIGVVGRIDP